MENKMRKVVIILVCCGVFFWQLLFVGGVAADELGRLIYEKNSLYHRICVYQQGAIATLQFGRRNPVQMQSRVDMSNLRQHKLEYTTLSFCGLLYKPEPKKVLVVGLGGGVIPRELRYYFPEAQIDVAEIDPEVLPIATRFFSFNEDDRLKVHISDGRMFVKKQLRLDPVPKYDIVILDAFSGDYIPFHLMTKEFLEEVKGVLANDGVVVANVFYSNRLFDAEFKTFLSVFGRCQAFFGVYSTNAMLVALGPGAPTLTVKEAIDRAQMLQQKHVFAFDMLAVARQLQPDARPDSRAKVLIDDRAPVDWLRSQERRKSP